MSGEKKAHDEGTVVVQLEDWFTPPDPRETYRREIGEQQRQRVKRRRRKPKTEPKR